MFGRIMVFMVAASLFLALDKAVFALDPQDGCPFREGDKEIGFNIDSVELYGEVVSVVPIKDECPRVAPEKILINVLNDDGGCRGERWFFIKEELPASRLQPGYRFSFFINKSECVEEGRGEGGSPLVIIKFVGE